MPSEIFVERMRVSSFTQAHLAFCIKPRRIGGVLHERAVPPSDPEPYNVPCGPPQDLHALQINET